MNLFAGLLFLHGHIGNADLASSLADAPAEHDGQTDGNHVATNKALREPWDQRRRDPSPQPIRPTDPCGGCA